LMSRVTRYNGVLIETHKESFVCPDGRTFWLRRRLEDEDIDAIKSYIDAGRQSMAVEIHAMMAKVEKVAGA